MAQNKEKKNQLKIHIKMTKMMDSVEYLSSYVFQLFKKVEKNVRLR